jgi:hypothetical protein
MRLEMTEMKKMPARDAGQSGKAFTETVLVLISITVVSLVVSFVFLGSTWFSPAASATNLGTPGNFQASPGAFTPIKDLESGSVKNPDRVYSTVKSAIADFNNGDTDNTSLHQQYNPK